VIVIVLAVAVVTIVSAIASSGALPIPESNDTRKTIEHLRIFGHLLHRYADHSWWSDRSMRLHYMFLNKKFEAAVE
jgi:hypothetical protein